MKTLIALCALLALAACATQPAPMSGAATSGSAIVVGTLADANNPAEMDAAPLLTRVIVVRKRALSALRGGLITSFEAGTLQASADVARTAIDEMGKHKHNSNAYRAALKEAKDSVLAAELQYDALVGRKQP